MEEQKVGAVGNNISINEDYSIQNFENVPLDEISDKPIKNSKK